MSNLFHSGPYEGMEMEQVVEIDPAYILELADKEFVPVHLIYKARVSLDSREEWDDFFVAEEDLESFVGYRKELADYE